MPCLGHVPIKSAMPKYHSKFPIAFYAHLVTLDRYSLIEHTPRNSLYQAMEDLIQLGSTAASFGGEKLLSINSDYILDIHCWRYTMKKRLAKIKKMSEMGLEPGQLLYELLASCTFVF